MLLLKHKPKGRLIVVLDQQRSKGLVGGADVAADHERRLKVACIVPVAHVLVGERT